MGFPIRKLVVRSTLIAVMLGGGLLSAGISQAQDAGVQEERNAELVAASGGPASSQHLIPFASERAAVEARDADVAGSTAEAAPGVAASSTAAVQTPTASGKIAAAETAPTR